MRFFEKLILLFLFSHTVCAEQNSYILPSPLTLDYALGLANDLTHPQLMDAGSALELARSELLLAQSATALQVELELRAATIAPSSLALDPSTDDHRATLRITKPLYDFGRAENNFSAADADHQAIKTHMAYIIANRRLLIARRFFSVLLADLKYSWHNEAMAIAFIRFDAAEDRYALKQISSVDLLQANNNYQQVRNQRYASEVEQRTSRAMLAEVLNRPGELSSHLEMPVLQYHKKKILEYDMLLDELMRKNSLLALLKTKVKSAHKRLQAARKKFRPELDAKLEISGYSRESASREDWRAEINLTIPLLEHAGMQAEISRQRSNWLKQRAMLITTQSELRQRLLVLWQRLRLLKVQREQMTMTMELRELELDRNRALYEMEVKTNLGDAMVAVSETQYKQQKTNFELALTWMELQILLNNNFLDGESF